jgi:2,2-dialkylglycine decarboxylase (pyruvate)
MTAIVSSSDAWRTRYGEFLFELPHSSGVVPVRAIGSEFIDADGRSYLDLGCGQMCALLGHGHPRLVERVVGQLRHLIHSGSDMVAPPVYEAAAKLAEVAPSGLKRLLLLSTGSEANEAAIRIARARTGRKGIVGLAQGYYGITEGVRNLGLLAAGANPAPDFHRVGSVDELRDLLRAEGDGIAAMIVEPIRVVQGVVVPPPGFLRELKAALSDRGALLIVDECQTGFGRTGRWFGVEHHGVSPDLLVFAKGAGGGFPVSGVLATDDVALGALAGGFSHISSHQQEPLAAAALSAVIDVIREEGLVERAAGVGAFLRERLLSVRDERPDLVADVRGQGLLLGVEVRHPGSERERDAWAARLYAGMLSAGVRFGSGSWNGVFRLAPALTISESEILRAVDVFRNVLRETPP